MTGNLAEMMTDYDKAMSCYESALRHNPYSVLALSQIASLCRGREQFARAVDYFKRILAIQENNGETWAALGHCYLMMDNLQEAYQAYQQALYHLSNPKVKKNKIKKKVPFVHTHINLSFFLGPQALVWYWYSLRSLWFIGTCRGSLFGCDEDGSKV